MGNSIRVARRQLQPQRLEFAVELDLSRGPRPDVIAKTLCRSLARSKARAKISYNACVKQLRTKAQGHAVGLSVRQPKTRLRTCRRLTFANYFRTAIVPQ
jgi:hypothetical protein